MPDEMPAIGFPLADDQATELLRLIDVAVSEYGSTSRDMTLEEFVEDIAMSMDATSDEADRHRANIQSILLN